MRPPFSYYGGKTTLAAQIVALLPQHSHYVEPFAGSLAVLLAKPPSPAETVNDLDGDLMTFWRVLRDRPQEFARVASLTPHSRAEHAAARDLDGAADDLERARRIWVLLSQGRAGTLRNTGWRFYCNPGGTSSGMPEYLDGYVNRLLPVADRLRGVSLECRPALEVIASYGRHKGVLVYADPPYVGSTRARNYRHEMASDAEHAELAEALHGCTADVVLSGYRSSLYDDLYADWHAVELSAFTGNSERDGGRRMEVLWSNRPLAQQLVMAEGGAA